VGFYLARIGIILVVVLSLVITLLGGLTEDWIVINYPNLNQYLNFFGGIVMFSIGCLGILGFTSMLFFPLFFIDAKIEERYPKFFKYGVYLSMWLVSFFLAKNYGQIFHSIHEYAYLLAVFVVNPIVVIVFFSEDKIKN
tara:strand:+ start:4974 stop:5390 length:417 start_codon:yes stop_codon:yes gene_type:complete